MKKNATFITINPTLAKWVYEQVQNAPTDLNYELENLQHSFKDLINGNINNLILEISDNTSPLFVDEKLTKEQIYQAVWEEDFLLSDNNIMAFIRKLRKKIEPQADLPGYIITIWGIGYKFNENI